MYQKLLYFYSDPIYYFPFTSFINAAIDRKCQEFLQNVFGPYRLLLQAIDLYAAYYLIWILLYISIVYSVLRGFYDSH
ncbi:MAG: hypothetical protein ACI80L_000262 [Pseudohongiellaceae bacterium]|jgi:hypothetical protein